MLSFNDLAPRQQLCAVSSGRMNKPRALPWAAAPGHHRGGFGKAFALSKRLRFNGNRPVDRRPFDMGQAAFSPRNSCEVE